MLSLFSDKIEKIEVDFLYLGGGGLQGFSFVCLVGVFCLSE